MLRKPRGSDFGGKHMGTRSSREVLWLDGLRLTERSARRHWISGLTVSNKAETTQESILKSEVIPESFRLMGQREYIHVHQQVSKTDSRNKRRDARFFVLLVSVLLLVVSTIS